MAKPDTQAADGVDGRDARQPAVPDGEAAIGLQDIDDARRNDAQGDGDESAWGFEARPRGLSLGTKVGLALILILVTAFGFVVYRKLSGADVQVAEKADGVDGSSDLLRPTNPAEPAEPSPTGGDDDDPQLFAENEINQQPSTTTPPERYGLTEEGENSFPGRQQDPVDLTDESQPREDFAQSDRTPGESNQGQTQSQYDFAAQDSAPTHERNAFDEFFDAPPTRAAQQSPTQEPPALQADDPFLQSAAPADEPREAASGAPFQTSEVAQTEPSMETAADPLQANDAFGADQNEDQFATDSESSRSAFDGDQPGGEQAFDPFPSTTTGGEPSQMDRQTDGIETYRGFDDREFDNRTSNAANGIDSVGDRTDSAGTHVAQQHVAQSDPLEGYQGIEVQQERAGSRTTVQRPTGEPTSEAAAPRGEDAFSWPAQQSDSFETEVVDQDAADAAAQDPARDEFPEQEFSNGRGEATANDGFAQPRIGFDAEPDSFETQNGFDRQQSDSHSGNGFNQQDGFEVRQDRFGAQIDAPDKPQDGFDMPRDFGAQNAGEGRTRDNSFDSQLDQYPHARSVEQFADPQPSEASPPREDRRESYTVQANDNFWTISEKKYGSGRYFMALARYNRDVVPDPKRMRDGVVVKTPPARVLETRYPDLFPKQVLTGGDDAVVPAGLEQAEGYFRDANGAPRYRIGQNDTLTGIAQNHLGRSARWVQIFEMNRDRLQDADSLKIGTVLRLPADATRVQMLESGLPRR